MLAGAFCFSLTALFVRLLRGLPFMEIVVIRSVVTAVLSFGFLWSRRLPFMGTHRGLLFLRGLLGFFGLSAYFYTLMELPLAEAVTLQYLNPVFAAAMSPWLLGERWKGSEWAAILLAFLGVVAIANPSVPDKWFVACVGVFGALMSGAAYGVVRKLGLLGESSLNIVVAFPVVAFVLGLPLAVPVWAPPTQLQWLMLLGLGVVTQAAQIFLTIGLRLERAAKATAVNYSVILFSTFYSVFLGEGIPLASWVGMACIIGGLALVSRKKKARPEPYRDLVDTDFP